MHPLTPTAEACRAAAQLGRTVNVALDDSPLTPAAYRLLAYLSTGTTAANVLAEKLAVSRPTVTAATDWLVAQGFATRGPDSDDRRRVAIAMTREGSEALVEADKLIAARLVDVLGPLAPEDAAAVLRALDRLLDALNDYRLRKHESRKEKPPSR